MKLSLSLPLGSVMVVASILGCAGTPAPAAASADLQPMRLLLTLSQPLGASPGAEAALEADASQAAGVTVRYLAAVSPLVHVVSVDCGPPQSCDSVQARLRQDKRHFVDVQADARRRATGS